MGGNWKQGGKDSLIGKALTGQSCRPEFRSPACTDKSGHCVCNSSDENQKQEDPKGSLLNWSSQLVVSRFNEKTLSQKIK